MPSALYVIGFRLKRQDYFIYFSITLSYQHIVFVQFYAFNFMSTLYNCFIKIKKETEAIVRWLYIIHIVYVKGFYTR